MRDEWGGGTLERMWFQRISRGVVSRCERIADSAEREPRIWMIGICALFAVQISPWWYPVPDGAHYLSLARSVAEGGPIRRLGMSNIGYFPGYIAAIWPAFLFLDRPFLLLSIEQWCIVVVLVAGVHRWFRRVIPECAVLATGVAMANIAVWELYRRTLSEIVFAAALIWAANLIRAAEDGAGRRGSWARFAWAGLCVMVAALIRPVGCALGAGYGLSGLLAVAGRRMGLATAVARCAAICLPAALAVAATLVIYRGLEVPASGPAHTYLDDIVVGAPDWPAQVAEGVRLRICEVGRLLIPGMSKAYADAGHWFEVVVAVHLVFFILVAIGWWRWVCRDRDAFGVAIPVYMGAHAIFPFEQGTRYIMPLVAPLLASLWFAVGRLGGRRRGMFVILLLAHLGIAVGCWVFVDAPMAKGYDRQWRAIDGIVAAIGKETETVALRGVPLEPYSMFMLAADRTLDFGGRGAPVGSDVRRVVVPVGAEHPEGFQLQGTWGDYDLLRR